MLDLNVAAIIGLELLCSDVGIFELWNKFGVLEIQCIQSILDE
jgi:hypothetical protein